MPVLDSSGGAQCFPFYIYGDSDGDPRDQEGSQQALFGEPGSTLTAQPRKRLDGITKDGLSHFQAAYPGEPIQREDIFYYVYGLLHSSDYRDRFADNLSKELPRIPCVSKAANFWALSAAGRRLAELHLGYEQVQMFAVQVDGDEITKPPRLKASDYRVEKMKFGKVGKEKDLTTIHYNDKISIRGIPVEAYEYVVNGKSAIEWVMERQVVRPDKDTGIVNDANQWAIETAANPRYPLELLLRVVTVSVETTRIVKGLPALEV